MTSDANWINEISKTYLEEATRRYEECGECLSEKSGLSRATLARYVRGSVDSENQLSGAARAADAAAAHHGDLSFQSMLSQDDANMAMIGVQAGSEKHRNLRGEYDAHGHMAAAHGRAAETATAAARAAMRKVDQRRQGQARALASLAAEETITNEQLVESVNYLTEEQQNLFVLSFVDDLLENFSWEEIDALTEEQLEEGLMAKLKGYAGGALAAAKSAPISQFLSKAKQYGAERTERFEKQEAETAHTKELEKARGEAKGGVRRATDAELHSIVNKLGKSKGAANKAILAKAQETLGRRAEDAAGKGLGGLVAKTRGLLGNKAAMRERVAKMAERSKTAAGKVNVDAGATVAAARRGHKKTTVANIQALRARGKETSKEIGRLQKTLPRGK